VLSGNSSTDQMVCGRLYKFVAAPWLVSEFLCSYKSLPSPLELANVFVGCCIDKCLKLCLLCVVLCALVTCLGSYRCTVFCVVLRQPVSGLVGVLWAVLCTGDLFCGMVMLTY